MSTAAFQGSSTDQPPVELQSTPHDGREPHVHMPPATSAMRSLVIGRTFSVLTNNDFFSLFFVVFFITHTLSAQSPSAPHVPTLKTVKSTSYKCGGGHDTHMPPHQLVQYMRK